MEGGSKTSCRLSLDSRNGRVRWFIGDAARWKTKVKFLAIVPIILLILVVVVYYSKTTGTSTPTPPSPLRAQKGRVTISTHQNDEFHEIPTTIPPSTSTLHIRNKRGMKVKPDESKSNISDINNLMTKIFSIDYPNYDFINKSLPVKTTLDATTMMETNPNYLWNNELTKQEVRQAQANLMSKYMDSSVNPCDDFYQYACGNWDKYNPVPPDRYGLDTFEILRENLDIVLKDLILNYQCPGSEKVFEYKKTPHLFKHPKLKKETNAIVKLKYLYLSCINEDILVERGTQPLLDLLQILGGWPIIEQNWNETTFDWLWLIAQLSLYNNDILISQWIGPDVKNSIEYVIQFDQTSLGLPSRDYFLDPTNLKYLEAYRVYIINIATLMGSPIIKATKEVDELIEFETELAIILATPETRKNVSDIYKKITIGKLQHIIPQIDWLRYLNIVLGKPILPTQPIICFSITYLQELVILLSQTPQRTIANYIMWRFVRHRVNNLDYRFEEAKQRFYYVLFGRERSPPRWETCIAQVNSNMGMAVGSIFVQNYFDEISKNDTLQMTKDIQQSFKELLLKVNWLDSNTKKLAKIKVDAMRLGIGYPDFILNSKDLSDRYHDVHMHPHLYFENTLSILKHLAKIEQNKLGHFVNKSTWNSAPAVVNAYYSRNKNQIMFPAGILQPPFYQRYYPRSLNYGGIGVVIGHEITHGFDDKGRLFDKDGNLQRWWQDRSIQEFHLRSKCLIDQYNRYVIPDVDIQVDGLTTQGENIADNGGIKQAFNAYKHWLEKHPHEDESLPGLNLTNAQLFFLHFAQVWCGNSRPEATRNKLQTAVHSPGRFRVIGTLSNSYDFAKSYQCPLGSYMNPYNKCSVW